MSDETSINDQVKESISQIRETVMGTFESQGQAAAYQMMTHAVGLAMLNAVSCQQQTYILRNAITTAAVKSTLQSSPEEALKMAEKMLDGQDIVATFSGLKNMMDDMMETLNKMNSRMSRDTTSSGEQASKNQDSGEKANPKAKKNSSR